MAGDFHILANHSTSGTFSLILENYVWTFYVSFLACCLLTPLLRRIAFHYGIFDVPDESRKHHKLPVAYLGGVALFFGWIAGLGVSYLLPSHVSVLHGMPAVESVSIPYGILLGAVVILILGLCDDMYKISAKAKLGGQFVAALFLAMDGLGAELMRGASMSVQEVMNTNLVLPDWFYIITGALFVLILVIASSNSLNLIDGLDGLAAGVTAIMGMAFLVIALCLASGLYPTVTGDEPINAVRITVCVAMVGAVLGFLPYNFRPAVIYMGDAGSMVLGYMCSAVILLLGETGQLKILFAAFIIFALPFMDVILAVVRRSARKQSVFKADDHHLHHLLVLSGFSVRQAVLILYGMTLLFGVLGVAMIFVELRFVFAVFLFIFGFIAVTAYKVAYNYFQQEMGEAMPVAMLDGDLVDEGDDEDEAEIVPAEDFQLGDPTKAPPAMSGQSGAYSTDEIKKILDEDID